MARYNRSKIMQEAHRKAKASHKEQGGDYIVYMAFHLREVWQAAQEAAQEAPEQKEEAAKMVTIEEAVALLDDRLLRVVAPRAVRRYAAGHDWHPTPEDIGDAVQEGLMAWHRRLERVEGFESESHVIASVCWHCQRALRDEWGKRARRASIAQEYPLMQAIDRPDLGDNLRDAIHRVDLERALRDQELVTVAEAIGWQELSLRDAAEWLGLSLKQVRTRKEAIRRGMEYAAKR